MEFLTSWIANILLFIMLAAVVELLLPQTSMQKYVKLVLGLCMIIIVLTPIFKLFSLDPEQILEEFENQSMDAYVGTENSLEKKKVEIQAQQRAYILEQTAVQLEKYVEKELMHSFGYTIGKIEFDLEDDRFELPLEYDRLLDRMERVIVVLEREETWDNGQIQEVVVQPFRSTEKGEKVEDQMLQFLSKSWEIDKEKIELQVEGGNGGN